MSQVAILPHQTNGGGSTAASAASSSSGSQPDIGQLSLNHINRRKSSFSSHSYRTMPLSRTRSLLANINGVANGASTNGSSTANTPGSEANGYLPSISDHLPPLKNGAAPSSASNNNKFYTNGYHDHVNDVMSVTTAATLAQQTVNVTNGHLGHVNGMQTLPHVRSSANIQAEDNLDNDKIMQPQQPQQNTSQAQQLPQSQASPTNSSAANNAVNSNNSGSLKPKTMVATPEQVNDL